MRTMWTKLNSTETRLHKQPMFLCADFAPVADSLVLGLGYDYATVIARPEENKDNRWYRRT